MVVSLKDDGYLQAAILYKLFYDVAEMVDHNISCRSLINYFETWPLK